MSLGGKGFLEVAGSRAAALAVLATITGLYYMIVAVTNSVDTDTNRRGVAAVLSMAQTIHHVGVDSRAITSDTAVWIAYMLIVIWEFLIALVLLAAAVAWWRVVAGRAVRDTAVRLASVGWTMVVLLFLGGFLTIGGEWFRWFTCPSPRLPRATKPRHRCSIKPRTATTRDRSESTSRSGSTTSRGTSTGPPHSAGPSRRRGPTGRGIAFPRAAFRCR